MKALITIPAAHKETAEECIKHIDEKFYKDIMLIDNTLNKDIGLELPIGYRETPQGNIGVARAWNLGVQKVIDKSYDFVILLSASMIFNDGMNGFMKELENNKDANGMATQNGWHCIALNRKVFLQIGDFDTNFYPAYYEDSDFIRRMELAGIHEPTGEKKLLSCTLDAYSTGIAHGMKKGGITMNIQACGSYFVEKWGNYPKYDSQESRDKLYKYPFNNSEFGLDYYPKRSIEELKLLYKLP